MHQNQWRNNTEPAQLPRETTEEPSYLEPSPNIGDMQQRGVVPAAPHCQEQNGPDLAKEVGGIKLQQSRRPSPLPQFSELHQFPSVRLPVLGS